MKAAYDRYLARRAELAASPLGSMYVNQEDRYVHPFRIFGNVWYVGDSWVCVHLIDTGDGLLLIDSGNTGATAMLVQAIWQAGFNPKDVKWIIHSHGHVDHIGGAMFFKRMFGTKLCLGQPDADLFRNEPWLALLSESFNDTAELFTPDVEIRDGDVMTFGNTEITFRLAPGHTPGVIACFFDAHDGGRTVRCGYFGGFGFNTMEKDYLLEIGDTSFNMRRVFLDSLTRFRDEKVELFLANHSDNNETLKRRQMQLDHPDGPNPFLDSNLWRSYLDQKRNDLLRFMADPDNN